MKTGLRLILILSLANFSIKLSGQYCTSFASSSVADSWDIGEIRIYDQATNALVFTNLSTCFTTGLPANSVINKYSNYTNHNILLRRGKTYKLICKLKTCNTTGNFSPVPNSGWNDHMSCYIDFNGNGNLVEFVPSDVCLDHYCNRDSIVVSNISIPTSATTLGNSLLRIVGIVSEVFPIDTGRSSSCGSFIRGETEDYTVHFCEPLTFWTDYRNPFCYGDSSGFSRINVTGGTAPINYQWDNKPFQTKDSINTLKAGKHYVTIKDADNCIYKDSFELFNHPKLKGIVHSIDSSCIYDSIGKIVAEGIGGVGLLEYRLNSGVFQVSNIFDKLYKGVYNLRIKDENSCYWDTVVSVGEKNYSKINYTYSIDSIHCHNQQDGAVSIHASNSIPPYSYNLDGSIFQFDSTLSGIDSGFHSVRIRDSKGCYKEFSFYLYNPSPLTIRILSLDSLECRGDSNGLISVKALGGREFNNSYSYFWSRGDTSSGISGLRKGNYRLTVMDRFLCRDSFQFAVDYRYDSLYLTSKLLHDVKCFYDSNAVIQLDGWGGKSPYSYSKDGVQYNSSNILSNLHYPEVHVYLKDAAGCIVKGGFVQTFIDTPFSYSKDYDRKLCYTNPATDIFFHPKNGRQPYSIQLENGSWLIDDRFINIATHKTYQFGIKDAKGCQYYDTFRIETLPSFSTNFSIQQNRCLMDSQGVLRIIGTSAKYLPVKYSIDALHFQDLGLFQRLKDGLYYIYTKDSLNCVIRDTFRISSSSKFSVSALVQDEKCHHSQDGHIRYSFSGHSIQPLISFQGGNFSPVGSFDSLQKGLYSFRIQYDSFCYLDTSFRISSPDSLYHLVFIDSVKCYNDSNGKISIQSVGGISPYRYMINSMIESSLPTFSELKAGDYSVLVKDKNGCTSSSYHSLSNPDRLEIQLTKQDISCFGRKDGVIQIIKKGGSPPTTFSFNGLIKTDTIFTNLLASEYQLILSDRRACNEVKTTSILEPEKFRIMFNEIKENKCFGDKLASLNVTGVGGRQPYQYRWRHDSQVSSYRNQLSSDTIYQVEGRDASGCLDTISHRFSSPSKLELDVKGVKTTCYTSSDGTILAQARGSIPFKQFPFYQYSLNQGNFHSDNYFVGLIGGKYQVTVRDSIGCQKDTTYYVETSTPIKLFMDSVYFIEKLGGTFELKPFIIGKYDSIRWIHDVGLSCSDCLSPVFSGYVNTDYWLKIFYNEGKCVDSFFTKMIVPPSNPRGVYIPNAFSPNSHHSENREFRIYGENISKVFIQIFNRWGEKVFETNQPHQGWDGMYKGDMSNSGMYMYYVELEFLDGVKTVHKGSVYLIR